MNSQKGACVLDCGDGMLPDAHRKCVPCDGPCPKSNVPFILFYQINLKFNRDHCDEEDDD